MTLDDKLIHFCKQGNLAKVKRLVERGANIHAYGDSALRWTSYYAGFNWSSPTDYLKITDYLKNRMVLEKLNAV